MEFPDLGKQCALETCQMLDFLPITCDACGKIFCGEHVKYEAHDCTVGRNDRHVPICPLCQLPVPLKACQTPDDAICTHIDKLCDSISAVNQRRIYLRKCSMKGCKRREAVSIKCVKCSQEFCIRHRLEADHNCSPLPKPVKKRDSRNTGATSGFNPQANVSGCKAQNIFKELQGDIDEDEALACALALSLNETLAVSSQSQKPKLNDHDAQI